MKKRFLCFLALILLSACAGEGQSPIPSETNLAEPTASYPDKPAWGQTEYEFTKTDDKTGDTVMTAKYILPDITNASDIPQWTAIHDYYTAEGESLLRSAEQTGDIAQEGYDYCKTAGFEFYPYSDEQAYEIKLSTERYVSVLRIRYGYTGGAHGEVCYFADSFDMTTGELLEMDDLFTVPSDEYNERVLTEMRKLAAKMVTSDGMPLVHESVLESALDHNCFYLTEDALVIYCQTYAYGPYEPGVPEFPIPREVLEDILITW